MAATSKRSIIIKIYFCLKLKGQEKVDFEAFRVAEYARRREIAQGFRRYKQIVSTLLSFQDIPDPVSGGQNSLKVKK